MKSFRCLALALGFLLLTTPAAPAWDQKGHRVVAAIAWDHLDADIRVKAAAILRAAPADSGLLDEDATSTLPQPERDRALFLRAATWPDLVRSTAHPARRAKYHRGPWHYVNIFWQERAHRPIERKVVASFSS